MGVIYITGLNETKYDQNLALFLCKTVFENYFGKHYKK